MRLLTIGAVAGLALAQVGAAQWMPPVERAELNSAAVDLDPSLSPDGTTIYFASDRGGGNWEIYTATRTAPYGPFANVTRVSELGTQFFEAGPCVRADNLEIFFTTSRTNSVNTEIWRATRPTPTAPFSPPTPVPELNAPGSSRFGPSLTADGLTICFTRYRAGAVEPDMWIASRASLTQPFSSPTPLIGIHSKGPDLDPHIAADGLSIVFTSYRGNRAAALRMATRASRAEAFSAPILLPMYDSLYYNGAPGLSTAGDEMVFASARPGGAGLADIYVSRFRGLTTSGVPQLGNPVLLTFSDPGSPGAPYVAAASLSDRPGIRIGPHTVPLAADALFATTIGGLPPALTGFAGTLDADGVARGQVLIRTVALVGTRLFIAFVVIDPGAPAGIRTVSNAIALRIQR